jgi:hypothetical protein
MSKIVWFLQEICNKQHILPPPPPLWQFADEGPARSGSFSGPDLGKGGMNRIHI